jgi:hypothetical protein
MRSTPEVAIASELEKGRDTRRKDVYRPTLRSFDSGSSFGQPSSKLCRTCTQMLEFFSEHSGPCFDWYNNIEDVSQSVIHSGCSLCYQFWRGADTDLESASTRYKGWKSRWLTLNPLGDQRGGARAFGWDLYHPLGASKGWKTVYVWKVPYRHTRTCKWLCQYDLKLTNFVSVFPHDVARKPGTRFPLDRELSCITQGMQRRAAHSTTAYKAPRHRRRYTANMLDRGPPSTIRAEICHVKSLLGHPAISYAH